MTILIVGGGKMGMSHLALCTPYVGKGSVALCDTKFLTRQIFRFLGYTTFSTVDQAAEKLDRIHGVVIATPTSSHAPLGRWAISKGIPVFIEKPLTLNVALSEELERTATAASVPAQVGFVMRYVASFNRLRDLVGDGSLGRVQSYTATMRGNVMTKKPPADSWQGDFSRGGGCLNEYGPHIIDLCCFIFGPVGKLDEAHAEYVHCDKADDRMSAQWTHDSSAGDYSVPGQLVIDWCDPTKRKSVIEIVIDFEHARLRVDNSAVDILWHTDNPYTDAERAKINLPVQPANVGYYLRGEEFSLELEDFLETCWPGSVRAENRIVRDATPSLSDGCEVDRLIDLIACKAGLR